jgi:hypothetical protein
VLPILAELTMNRFRQTRARYQDRSELQMRSETKQRACRRGACSIDAAQEIIRRLMRWQRCNLNWRLVLLSSFVALRSLTYTWLDRASFADLDSVRRR